MCSPLQAQWAADYPAALKDAPRLGAVSQFPHSLERFRMMRPEVEVRSPACFRLNAQTRPLPRTAHHCCCSGGLSAE